MLTDIKFCTALC